MCFQVFIERRSTLKERVCFMADKKKKGEREKKKRFSFEKEENFFFITIYR